jgi:hypothetical protein
MVSVLWSWRKLLRYLREPRWSGTHFLEMAPSLLLLAGI